jgi:predicted nucleic acid-binding protein
MGPVVADASAFVAYLLRVGPFARVEEVVTHERTDLHIPGLCDVELASALRRGLLAGAFGSERAGEAVRDYLALGLIRHHHDPLIERILELRNNFTAYDATYVALAEALGAAFMTADSGLAAATRRHTGLNVLAELA